MSQKVMLSYRHVEPQSHIEPQDYYGKPQSHVDLQSHIELSGTLVRVPKDRSFQAARGCGSEATILV